MFLDEAALDKVQPSMKSNSAFLPFGADINGGESPFKTGGASSGATPLYALTPAYSAVVSPTQHGGWMGSPMGSPGGSSPAWARHGSPAPSSSPVYGGGFSPASPSFSPASPGLRYGRRRTNKQKV